MSIREILRTDWRTLTSVINARRPSDSKNVSATKAQREQPMDLADFVRSI
ncbi:hypothetical protein [Lactiplantibacillus paraxiangfangensis]